MQNKRFIYTEGTENLKPSLPESYANILPATNTKPEPLNRTRTIPCSNTNNLNGIELWIKQLSSFGFNNNQEKEISFAAFFSANSSSAMQKLISTLFPILEDSINSTAMVHNCIEIVRNTINHLNPGQITILIANQPAYALGKQVQWTYHENYKDVTWLMGPLHIEMALMNAFGNWIQGSGWVEAFVQANITTAGRIDSFLNGSKVKITHYAHQLSLAVLVKLSHNVFDDQREFNNYIDWRNHLVEENANASYWFQLIQLETLLFTFIKSLRDADFELFPDCLKSIKKWMFSLDHVHYARWLTVFIKDL